MAIQPFADVTEIAHTPGVCGGCAHVAGTRIPVWILEQLHRESVLDVTLLEMYPSLTISQIRAALTYAAACPEEIDADIQSNHDA